MKIVTAAILASGIALGFTSAAHAQAPQIPTPANPYPINPIATDGTPLPSQSSAVRSGDLYVGRSVAVGAPLGVVGEVAGAGLNAAGSVVGTGLDVVGVR